MAILKKTLSPKKCKVITKIYTTFSIYRCLQVTILIIKETKIKLCTKKYFHSFFLYVCIEREHM